MISPSLFHDKIDCTNLGRLFEMKKIALLYGGKSAEHEVSLSTAKSVMQALNFNEYEVYPVFITLKGEWIASERLLAPVESIEALQLQGQNVSDNITSFIQMHEKVGFDVVLPLLHGTNGEDGTVQGLLEVLNLPYVGNGVLASSAGMDKVVMKQLFEIAGLKQTPYTYFIRSEWEKNEESVLTNAEASLRYPMFVKPANLGSSVGISKATNRVELKSAVEEALKFDRKIVIEQGVVGREIETAVLGNDEPKTSVVGEIKQSTDFYDYDSKYKNGTVELVIPADVTTEVDATISDMAKRAFKILDGAGLVRADFFVTADNEVFINEVNSLPGFTPFSMYPLLWEKSGLGYSDLINELIAFAEARYAEKQKLQFNRG